MKKHHITYLFFFTFFLMVSCGEIFHYSLDYKCFAKNETILMNGGVPIDTFYFYDTITTTITDKKYRIDKIETIKDTLSFSKDSVLKFFYSSTEYFDRGLFYEDYEHEDISADCGLIVEPDDNNHSLTLFITHEEYELLKDYVYDSVVMIYVFRIIVHG